MVAVGLAIGEVDELHLARSRSTPGRRFIFLVFVGSIAAFTA